MRSLILSIISVLVCAAFATAQHAGRFPSLQGETAVKKLKETRSYDSLIKAVKGATQNSNQLIDEQVNDATVQSGKLSVADGAAGDQFGWNIAIDGTTAIVTANLDDVGVNADQGSAYVFVLSGSTWTQQAKLTASDGGVGDQFGYVVGISGDTAILGAFADDIGGNTDQGSAYIFVRSGSTWTQQAKLTATDGTADDQFGIGVGISGNTVVVGAVWDDVGANRDQGSAYVFVRSGTTWSLQQKLTAADGTTDDWLGNAVAISGDTVVAGAPTDAVGGVSNRGSAYIFVRSGTVWTQQAKLLASDGAAEQYFGQAVAISGDTVLSGSYDTGNRGAAYVFVRSGSVWTQQQKLMASDGASGDYFGTILSLGVDTAVIGAFGDDIGAKADQGSAYVFNRRTTAWFQDQKLTAADGLAGDQFGTVGISGNTLVVGAPFVDITPFAPVNSLRIKGRLAPNSGADQGAFYAYVNLLPTAANVSISGRVFNPSGGALMNAIVVMTQADGTTRAARTNNFGNYVFQDVPAGGTCILMVNSKRYKFAPKAVGVSEVLTDLNFYPLF